MKTSNDKATGFTPITLSFTCETQAELDAFYTLAQCNLVMSALHEMFNLEPLRLYDAFRGLDVHSRQETLVARLVQLVRNG